MSAGVVDWGEVGRRLRHIRSEHGLSQREFGRRFGISQNMISLYEKGKSRAPVDFYVRAAQLGGKTIEWLLTGREDRTLETLHEMRDLHEKMKGHLATVRQLLNQESEAALDQRLQATDDPDQVRRLLFAKTDLCPRLKEALEDPDVWRSLAMTGREVCAFCNLAITFGELDIDGLRLFLRLVRAARPRSETPAPRPLLRRDMGKPGDARPLPPEPI